MVGDCHVKVWKYTRNMEKGTCWCVEAHCWCCSCERRYFLLSDMALWESVQLKYDSCHYLFYLFSLSLFQLRLWFSWLYIDRCKKISYVLCNISHWLFMKVVNVLWKFELTPKISANSLKYIQVSSQTDRLQSQALTSHLLKLETMILMFLNIRLLDD